MFAFELGREFKLSIAEILAVFTGVEIIFCNKQVLIVDNISKEEIIKNAPKLGGTIKIIAVKEFNETPEDILRENLALEGHEGKFNYAMNAYGNPPLNSPLIRGAGRILKELLKISKAIIKEAGFNPRFINQDFKNISSVAIIKEALIKKETDYNFIFTKNKTFFGHTIFVQNIYSYSNRDYSKERDMNVGMLPPKLAQMMINLSTPPAQKFASPSAEGDKRGSFVVYDPFVGLGTVLIESVYMGNNAVFGSDLSTMMVQKSSENLKKIQDKFNFEFNIFNQNAKYINEIDILDKVDAIVSEGYLGEIMTKNNINTDRIDKQKEKLKDLYEGFFSGLKKLNFSGNIVISFPFWEIDKKYFYFDEIYDILGKYTTINELLPSDFEFQVSKSGSLLYKRDSQLVGREIFSLKLK